SPGLRRGEVFGLLGGRVSPEAGSAGLRARVGRFGAGLDTVLAALAPAPSALGLVTRLRGAFGAGAATSAARGAAVFVVPAAALRAVVVAGFRCAPALGRAAAGLS